MTSFITTFLESKGFNKKDIAVYLDISKYGISYASSIAIRTKIDRTTVYSALKRLLQKGVIAQTEVNDVRAYMSVSPEIFLSQIERKIEDLNDQKKSVSLFLEEMKKLKKQTYEKPKIQIFEGDEAIISLYDSTLEKGGEQKSFLTLDKIPKPLEAYLKKTFIAAKIKKNVHSKVIVCDSPRSRLYESLDRKSNRETKIVKNHPFSLASEIILFQEKSIAIIDFHRQIYGIVIQSETLYKTIETLFDYVWSMN